MDLTRVILIPGNGNSSVEGLWFPYVREALEAEGLEVIARDFPDPELAREAYWMPFLRDELRADAQTLLIGHSSGAIAAMRFAETTPIWGSVLVGVYHTDLGMETEKAAGYFDRPWNWEAIRQNQHWIALFASTDDPWIPIAEPRYVRDQLQPEYHEFTDQGHFGPDHDKTTFPELVEAVRRRLKSDEG